MSEHRRTMANQPIYMITKQLNEQNCYLSYINPPFKARKFIAKGLIITKSHEECSWENEIIEVQ